MDNGRARALEARFWAKVDKRGEDECWLWTGAKFMNAPYGQFTVSTNKRAKAHRVSWELHHKEPLGDRSVLHRCDNPPCVNPAHLVAGTLRDNNLDMWTKGRQSGPPAANALKTHCLRGHLLSADNVQMKRGKRHCRKCHVIHNQEYRLKNHGPTKKGRPDG